MKKIYILFALLLQFFTFESVVAQTGQCLGGGCSTGVSWGATQSTTSATFVNSVGGTWGGEYNTYNVTAGQQYEWSLCAADGAVVGTNGDSQLSLRRNDNNAAICYSDDFCGSHAKILWTATFTGVVRVYVHRWNCQTASTSHTVRWRCVSCGPPPNPCAAAINISSLPVNNQSVVCSASNNLNSSNVPACGAASTAYMGGNEALYTVTPTTSGTYTISYNGQTWSSIWVWSNACPASGGTCVGSTSSSGSAQTLNVNFTAGVTYYIMFDTWPSPVSPCPGTFSITAPVPPPANDNCSGAITVACGNTVNVNTNNATTDPAGSNTCGTTITTPGVWYRITGNGQQMTVSTVGLTTSDTKLMVFSGSCAGLTCVGGIDDVGGTLQSSVTWNSVNGTTYYVLAALFSGTGTFPMSLTCVTPCPAPTNDLCANAPILDLSVNNNQTHLGTGCGSTATLGTFKEVWVGFTVPCGGMNVAIDFCGSSPVHNNAYLNIFSDCTFGTFTGAANWDFTSCPDGNIKLYWNNVPAGTYYYPILIDPSWETNYVLNISGTPLHTPAVAPTSITGNTAVCSGQNTTLTLQGGSAGTNGTPQWFAGSCGSAVIGTGNAITVSPTANTTYFVRYTSSCNTTTCASVAVNLNSNSTALTTISAPSGTVCPNTNVTLSASGGTAGTGSQISWYSGPNGTGTLLGTGSSVVVAPSSAMTVYARREGTCNTSSDQSASINLKNFVYAPNGTNASSYCTDNAGWHHFYTGDDIILSVRGNLSGVSSMTAQIRDNGSLFTDPGNPSNCLTGWTSGEAQFEMQRSWNVNYSGTLSGTYEVRYYFNPQERQDVIDAANTFMASNPSCGYFYKYNPANSGWFWFKNNSVAYSAPSFDDNPNFNLLSSTTPGSINGINYTEIAGITGFSGGTGGVVLLPGGFLPVEWLYFNAENLGNANRLLWATASEENTQRFDVERSIDGFNFEKIGTKAAAGNSSLTNYYDFTDNNPVNGLNYYRLRLVNVDGTEEFSEIKVLENKFNNNDFAVYPNPASDILHFGNSSETAEDIKVEILDILGRVVKTEMHKSVVGKNNLGLGISNLKPGSYSLRVTYLESNTTNTAKFVKK